MKNTNFYQTKDSIQKAHSQIDNQTTELTYEKKAVLDYIADLEKKNRSVLTRWSLSKHQKNLAEKIQNLQVKAFTDLANQRNVSLQIIGETQIKMLKEICNGIIISGRSGIQSSIHNIFMENFLDLIKNLEDLNDNFCQILDSKIIKLNNSNDFYKDMIFDQIGILKSKWMNIISDIYDEFEKIIQQKIQ